MTIHASVVYNQQETTQMYYFPHDAYLRLLETTLLQLLSHSELIPLPPALIVQAPVTGYLNSDFFQQREIEAANMQVHVSLLHTLIETIDFALFALSN